MTMKEDDMRNWTLTPAVVLSLSAGFAGKTHAAWTDIDKSLQATEAVSAHSHEHAVHSHPRMTIAGTVIGARQFGPIRSQDNDAGFGITWLDGPAPRVLRTWIGDNRRPHQAVVLTPEHRDRPELVTLELPAPGELADAHLWVEIEQVWGQRSRGAFHLLS